MRWVWLAVLAMSLAELPRDWSFWQTGLRFDPPLLVGMSIKVGSAVWILWALPRNWVSGWAALMVWCIQGLLISSGEWLGQAANPLTYVSYAVRIPLLLYYVRQRLLRRGGKREKAARTDAG